MTGITVILCCFNSESRLPQTLSHLSKQVTYDLCWEVVLVDNNSTDATAEVARRQWVQLGSPAVLNLVFEPKPGLSAARQKGLASSRYDLVLFCDDDNWLEPDYLHQAKELMSQDEHIGIIGGLNTAVADGPLPEWFSAVDYAYACGPQAEEDGNVSPQRLYVTGAGMVMRRNIFQDLTQAGFNSQLLDRTGENLSSGGDTELCFATALLGYRIVYSSRLRLWHYMDAKRLRWAYLLELQKGHGESYYKLEYYKKLYLNENIQDNWLALSARKVREMLSKRGLYVLYQYYVKSKKPQAGIPGVEAVFYYEKLKAHFQIRKHHAQFLEYLVNLKKNAASYRTV